MSPALVLIAQLAAGSLSITPSGPPEPPARAVEMLRRASPEREVLRGQRPLSEIELPVVSSSSVARRTPSGLVVPRIPALAGPIVKEIPGITFGLPCLPSQACASITIDDRRRHRR